MDSYDFVKEKISELLAIVKELEERFPGRKFTLDGHLLGSIGEVLAEYYYGVDLYRNSTKIHDGQVDGKNVQIKITQGTSVDIMDIPDYLIVLFLNKTQGKVYEVYNGPCVWLKECKPTKRGWFSRQLTKLADIDKTIKDDDRIKAIRTIEKWDKSMKNN